MFVIVAVLVPLGVLIVNYVSVAGDHPHAGLSKLLHDAFGHIDKQLQVREQCCVVLLPVRFWQLLRCLHSLCSATSRPALC